MKLFQSLTLSRRQRTLIIGVGARAQQVLREMRSAEICALSPVGLVALNDTYIGQAFDGLRILGTVNGLPALCKKVEAEFAIIALEAGEMFEMGLVVDQCIAAGIACKTVPTMLEVCEGTAGVNQLRNIGLNDLLSRPPVNLNSAHVAADLCKRVILVTGAGGAIGAELSRQIAPFQPARLVLLDQSEDNLDSRRLELSETFGALDIASVICDITNATRLGQVFAHHRPDYVIHSAAYQHVSLMESNATEAVRNNVLGTLLVATTAVRHGVKKMVLLSTEAVRPTSVVAATKRVAEEVIFGLSNLHRSGTDFRAVRFGNLLPSRAGLVQLERRLAARGPTSAPPAERLYSGGIPETAGLILQAGSLPETAGAIATLDLGEPIRVVDLVEKLKRIPGRVPRRSPVVSTDRQVAGEDAGLNRSWMPEATAPTSVPAIRVSHPAERVGPELGQKLSRLLAHLEDDDRDGLLSALCDLVPECIPPLAERREGHESQTGPYFKAGRSGAWPVSLVTDEAPWRDRRRTAVRMVPPADLNRDERRQGVVCRRKEARAGGRRETDTVVLLPKERASAVGGARSEHSPV